MEKKNPDQTIRPISLSATECFMINNALECAVDHVKFIERYSPLQVKTLILKLAGTFIDDQDTLEKLVRLSDDETN